MSGSRLEGVSFGLLICWMILLGSILASAAQTSATLSEFRIEIKVLPPILLLCIYPKDYEFSDLGLNETKTTWIPGKGSYFRIWNCGGFPINLTLSGTNASSEDGNIWMLSDQPGYNRYVLEYSINNTNVSQGDYALVRLLPQPLGSLPEPNDSLYMDFRITTPTGSGSYAQHRFSAIIGAYLA